MVAPRLSSIVVSEVKIYSGFGSGGSKTVQSNKKTITIDPTITTAPNNEFLGK